MSSTLKTAAVPPRQSRFTGLTLLALVIAAVTATYANHFGNSFHFDDFHSVTDNIFIRDLGNAWKILTDANASSILPANRAWRPLVTLSLALDYRMGRGYEPFWFHLSTLLWYLVQLGLMAALYLSLLRPFQPDPRARAAAFFAVAWYGLHPVMAETVNYIIQRAEIYSTLGVIAALLLFIRHPARRRFGLYLLPLAFGLLAKPPAVVFPILAAAYLWLFEEDKKTGRIVRIGLQVLPSIVFCGAFVALQAAMIPRDFEPGASSPFGYRITQPYVVFRYFVSFFLPLHLSADTDLGPFTSLYQIEVLAGSLYCAT